MAKLPVLSDWPVLRQIRAGDVGGLGATAASPRTRELAPRTASADRVARSVCPYCAVGCGQLVYVKDERIVDIEGDPDSPGLAGLPVPEGRGDLPARHRLAPRSSRSLYRRPGGTAWEAIPLERAMEMVAERVKRTRDETWQERIEEPGAEHEGARVRRTLGIAHLGGATLDNEENYLIKKLFTALGVVQVENQARI